MDFELEGRIQRPHTSRLRASVRGLARRGFVKTERVEDRDGDYDGAYVTDEGWRWIEEHDHLFNLEWRSKASVENDPDIDPDIDDDILKSQCLVKHRAVS